MEVFDFSDEKITDAESEFLSTLNNTRNVILDWSRGILVVRVPTIGYKEERVVSIDRFKQLVGWRRMTVGDLIGSLKANDVFVRI